MPELYQCLIFLVGEIRSASGRLSRLGSGCKGYVLLPKDFERKCPKVDDIFSNNNLRVLKDDQEYTLGNVTLELMEILLEETESEMPSVLAEEHNRKIINSLLKKATDISFVTQFKWTHLNSLHAVDVENMKGIEHLLRHDPNICLRHPKGGTVLHLAVARENTALVELLLKSGAEVNNARKNDAVTPLALSVIKKCSLDITRLLLQNGAETTIYCYFKWSGDLWLDDVSYHRDDQLKGGTPLHFAIDNCDFKTTELLLDSGAGVSVDVQNADGRTCLQLAVDSTDYKFVQALLKHNPDVNNANNHQSFVDAIYDSKKIVDVMSKYGFSFKPEDVSLEFLREALHIHNCKVIRDLLSCGVDLKGVDAKGRPASACVLKSAAMAGARLEMWMLLIEFGVDINARYDPLHESPVFYLLHEERNLPILKFLMENGLNVFERLPTNSYSNSLVESAMWAGSSEMVEILLKHGADVNSKEGSAIELSVFKPPVFMETLLKYGAHISFNGNEKNSPLHKAITGKCVNQFQILLNYCFPEPKLYENIQNNPRYFPGLESIILPWNLAQYKGGPELVARHVVKYEYAHPHVKMAHRNNTSLESPINFRKFRHRCSIEIERLKNERVVDGSVVSFYDLLIGNASVISGYARNEVFVQSLLSGEYKSKFPIYGDVINWQFWRGFYRRKILDRGVKVLPLIYEPFSALPYEITEKIVNYLTNWEILLVISDRSYVSEPLM